MTKLTYKESLTLKVLESLEGNNWTYEEAMKKWWFNPRRDGGLRLTQVGDLEFRYADFESFVHNFSLTKTSRSYYQFILDLDKKIKCPYFVDVDTTTKKPFMRLYDSRVYMMLCLYGDLESYLNSIKGKK